MWKSLVSRVSPTVGVRTKIEAFEKSRECMRLHTDVYNGMSVAPKLNLADDRRHHVADSRAAQTAARHNKVWRNMIGSRRRFATTWRTTACATT